MASRRMSRFGVATSIAAVVLSLSASAALAGEVTGNGTPLWTNTDVWGVHHTLHGRSLCAFSGQEDNQFLASPDYSPTAGHAQSWGQIPKSGEGFTRDLATILGFNPGIACNPAKSGAE